MVRKFSVDDSLHDPQLRLPGLLNDDQVGHLSNNTRLKNEAVSAPLPVLPILGEKDAYALAMAMAKIITGINLDLLERKHKGILTQGKDNKLASDNVVESSVDDAVSREDRARAAAAAIVDALGYDEDAIGRRSAQATADNDHPGATGER